MRVGAGATLALAFALATSATGCQSASHEGTPTARAASSPPSVSSAPPIHEVSVTTDCTHFGVRPARILIACGDGGFYLTDLTFDAWSRSGATGSGIAALRRCVPDCARGNFVRRRVHAELDRVRVVFGSPIFTRVIIRYDGTRRSEADYVLPLGCSVSPPSCPSTPP